jgi:hypothetical protein
MDTVTAFLNSKIDSDVYVDLPPGWNEVFKDKEDSDIYKLKKSLYRLKQSPRLWQEKL